MSNSFYLHSKNLDIIPNITPDDSHYDKTKTLISIVIAFDINAQIISMILKSTISIEQLISMFSYDKHQ